MMKIMTALVEVEISPNVYVKVKKDSISEVIQDEAKPIEAKKLAVVKKATKSKK